MILTPKKKSDLKISDTVAYLAFKYKLPENLVKNIVLSQFNYIKTAISNKEFKDMRLIKFGTFRVNRYRVEQYKQKHNECNQPK
jgi:nucleoid DNA-binding protein